MFSSKKLARYYILYFVQWSKLADDIDITQKEILKWKQIHLYAPLYREPRWREVAEEVKKNCKGKEEELVIKSCDSVILV